jgi:hypothetical protein
MADKKIFINDRILVEEDERQRIVDLRDFNLTLPTPDIFEAPLRCYKINHEWAKIVSGAVALVAEIAAWPDAANEDYIGIRKIREFLEGIDCVDCDYIESCLQTSPTIIDIQSDVSQNQTDIATNVVNIANNTSDIADNESDIVQLVLGQQQQQLQLDDHEFRIEELEGKQTKIVATVQDDGTKQEAFIWELASDLELIVAASNINIINLPHYREIKVVCEVSTDNNVGVNMYMGINGSVSGPSWRAIGRRLRWDSGAWIETNYAAFAPTVAHIEPFAAQGNDILDTVEIHVYNCAEGDNKMAMSRSITREDMSTDDTELQMYGWHYEVDGAVNGLEFALFAGNFVVGSKFRVYGLKQVSIVQPSKVISDIVNFDPDTYPYTLALVNDGVVENGQGNPERALVGRNLDQGDYIAIKVDFGELRFVTQVGFDRWTIDANSYRYEVWFDGVKVWDVGIGGTNGIWNFSFAVFADLATTVEFRFMTNDPGGTVEMRIDNIDIIREAP